MIELQWWHLPGALALLAAVFGWRAARSLGNFDFAGVAYAAFAFGLTIGAIASAINGWHS